MFGFAKALFVPALLLAQFTHSPQPNVGAFENTTIGYHLLGEPGKYAPLLKSEGEVQIYLRCYLSQTYRSDRKALARIKEFNATYKGYVQLSNEVFQMPYALSACTMFRETKLNNDLTSTAGAVTIAQFTPETYDTLKSTIKDTIRKQKQLEEFKSFFAKDPDFDMFASKSKNWFIKCNQYATGKGWYWENSTKKQRREDQGKCLSKLQLFAINDQLVKELKTYIRTAADSMDQKTYNKNFKTPRGQGGPAGDDFLPPSSISRFRERPMWLMGLKTYYLKQIAMRADNSFNPEGFTKTQDYLGFLAVVAGSYNRGPGKLLKAVRKPNGSIEKWCRDVASLKEPRQYMLSLKRCMVKGSNFAMEGMYQSDSCKEQPKGVRDISDPCALLLAPGDDEVIDLTEGQEFNNDRPQARPRNLAPKVRPKMRPTIER